MVPLARLTPISVETSATRFHVPAPRQLEQQAPLGLGRIEYRGPLVVRYALPAKCRRFSAEAHVPRSAGVWGDLELVIRDDDHEVFRSRLDATTPTAEINVPLSGSELTIELEQGEHGPIQDRLVVSRAMFLVGR